MCVQQDEPVAALRALVERASSSVDERLKGVTLGRLGFMRHCEALKALLLFSQGDFLSELLKHTADLLPRRASEVCPPPSLPQQTAEPLALFVRLDSDCTYSSVSPKTDGGGKFSSSRHHDAAVQIQTL